MYNEKLICHAITHWMKMRFKYFANASNLIALKDAFLEYQTDRREMGLDSHIYLILDNVERLFQVESSKRTIEKILIMCDMVNSDYLAAPMLNVMVINDTYIDELSTLGYSLLSEYNFTPYILDPMSTEHLKQILRY